MKYAAIDIGSNTIRLLVARVDGGCVIPLRHERQVTRLAAGLHSGSVLSDDPLNETIDAVRRFADIAHDEGVDSIRAVATSAIRESHNSIEVAQLLSAAAGFDVEVISGEEEGRITALGVMQGFHGIKDAIIFDLGGGSTEFICIKDGELVKLGTIPIGVVKLHEQCLFSDPPTESELVALETLIDDAIVDITHEFRSCLPERVPLIGTAGTATTLASVDLKLVEYDWKAIQGHDMSRDKLLKIEELISSVALNKRRLIVGMDPSRADLIIAGCRLTIKVMESLGYDHITVSDHGLLEGLIVTLHLKGGS